MLCFHQVGYVPQEYDPCAVGAATSLIGEDAFSEEGAVAGGNNNAHLGRVTGMTTVETRRRAEEAAVALEKAQSEAYEYQV